MFISMRERLEITPELAEKCFDDILDHRNAFDIKCFFMDILSQEEALSKFVEIYLGKEYPTIPEIGTQGDITVKVLKDRMYDSVARDKYLNSDLVVNDKLPVKVKKWRGIHRYCPLDVILPDIPDENMADIRKELSINLEDFNEHAPF